MNLADIADAVKSYHPNADLDIIWSAYIFTAQTHQKQHRRSGAA